MIKENVQRILRELSGRAEIVVAAKTRTAAEVREAVAAGIRMIGENYVQEAERIRDRVPGDVRWHCIGHLQKNKARKAVKIFDMIETLDSLALAEVLEKECAKQEKRMPVLIQVNCAREPQKSGVLPEETAEFSAQIGKFKWLQPRGLMTMGPFLDSAEALRPYFRRTRELFDEIAGTQKISSWTMLSMGMSGSYRVAVEEGATHVRLGTVIFGMRPK
ncbi:MAG: YggS family pyridoxal phosphate-dependent enzyme [Candidatus Omnitrophica bacterium]|nr:YggS family pyridoxal phosphate-dependent enzyme [Candidatus Omnitrophota bacterium]